MLPATWSIIAFSLLSVGLRGVNAEPSKWTPQLETDCSAPPARSQVEVLPDVSYPFRTDYLTLHEGMAYDKAPCSPKESDYGDVNRHGKADIASLSPFYKTYFELECTGYSWKNNYGGWRSFLRAYTKKFSIISPKRALTMNIRERSDIKDPVHSDVFEPVRGQVIDLTVQAGASTAITSKIYHIGVLPSLVALHIGDGRNLSIKRHDFNRIPNVRVIVFSSSTIMEMEPHTFTDLPHISGLSVDRGLRSVFNEIDEYQQWPGDKSFAGRWNDTDLGKVHRIHCDCSFAWYRNFLKSKSELTEVKMPGTMAVIGNYLSEYFNIDDFDPHMASVDCAKNLTKHNYRVGDQFAYNTTCYGPC